MSRIWPESHCTHEIGHQLLTDWTEISEIDTECHAYIKEVLRLKFEAKLSHEKIAAATGMSILNAS
jgi:hypothetical protein